ncbi:lipid A deacylase LpxR family protein [Marinobacter sp. TBZ242]|uniref:Lipid A deacylase LpxR family protein n=1 Tax=Marinobacter azerbaijanicus TaxID=3050455 RepID=A0ABT7IG69_9GAMM|nr:lipid A deacylase LpxR family protein [Marinobacter sp. TBZ242]MDL0433172.1 lipid A deacylase LpxR family protein [Marinobacter sp. TBZ242]
MRLIILLIAFVPGFAGASSGAFSISWDNDLLTGSDKGYTNGGRLSYLSASAENNNCEVCLARSARNAMDWLPVIGRTGNAHALTFSLSQLMVTPENIQASGPIYEDLPYVGYLSGSITLWTWSSASLTGYGIGLGVVGPNSGAEVTQKWVHKLTGSTNPNGWDNQLGTDVIGEVHAFHARRLFRENIGSRMHQEVAWVTGGRLSNFVSSGELGMSWRIGTNLPANIIPDYAGASSTIALPGSLNAPGSGWSVFIGLGMEFIPYSYLEEQSGRYDYDQRSVVGLGGVGVGWHSPGIQIALTLRATTSQDERDKDALSFGTVSAAYRF